jgi:hypothetical protein
MRSARHERACDWTARTPIPPLGKRLYVLADGRATSGAEVLAQRQLLHRPWLRCGLIGSAPADELLVASSVELELDHSP